MTTALNLALNKGMSDARAVVEAVERAGGMSELARKIGVSPQAVWKWLYVQGRVPATRVLEVERVSGVPREQLRPDVFSRPEPVQE